MSYVPLRVHTDFSLLESIIRPKAMVDFAIDNNMPAIAMTDSNNLFAAPEYSFYARSKKYPALLGCTLTTDQGKVVLYCKNHDGYVNLCRILSDFYMKYKGVAFPLAALKDFTTGLVALSGGVDGVVHNKANFLILYEFFGNDFALELNRTEGIHTSEGFIGELSAEYQVPVVGTSVANYLSNPQAYQVVKAVSSGDVIVFDNKEEQSAYKMLSPEEFAELFKDCPQVVENTILFAQKCSYLLQEIKPRFAFYADNAKELLDKWSYEGLESLISREGWYASLGGEYESEQAARKVYFDRLQYELDMINKFGFTDYFLIVADFVKWAREQKISLSARGSGAGSLVAWALFITCIDPLVYGLFFERFINPGRISLPDFDIDFCQERRQEVIEYVGRKYGKEMIAHIITFGAWHARGVLRDTGRALGISYKLVDRLCRRIPNNPNFSMTLQEALDADEELQKFYKEDMQLKRLFDISLELEGLHRNVSLHAAGIIIGYAPLRDIVPLYKTEDMSIPAVNYVMKYVEQVGLVKFDFLGLTALTIIDKILNYLEEDGVKIDISHIDITDQEVYKMLCEGLTYGVFQFESTGLTNVILRLQPSKLEELIAIISLYRPGPMEYIGEFLARKHGLSDISYDYPALEPILKPTFGIIVYQEQVISIARELAGYTLSEADLLRRAMGKKIAGEMEEQRDKFVKNVLRLQGDTEEKANELFEKIVKFSGYAFNKAHAASHAFIGYQTAYLKAHYPLQFMAVSLTMEKQRHNKIAGLIAEFKRLGLESLKPDINASEEIFTFQKPNKVLYCLSAIKSVGDGFVRDLKAYRERNGKFVSVEDFCNKIRPAKGVFEALILSGSLDALPIYEGQEIDPVVEHRNKIWQKKESLLNMLGRSIFEEQYVEVFGLKKLLLQEWKYTGVIMSKKVLIDLLPSNSLIMDSGSVMEQIAQNARKPFYVQGLVLDKQMIRTRQGKSQWVVKMADRDSVFEVFVKNELEEKININPGELIVVKSKAVRTFWIAENVSELTESSKPVLLIQIDTQRQLEGIHELMQNAESGGVEFVLKMQSKQLKIGAYKLEQFILDSLDMIGVQYKYVYKEIDI